MLRRLLHYATIVAMKEPGGHFHAWFRAGRIFTMNARVFNDRTVCHKWASKQHPAKEDRLVLACSKCPVLAEVETAGDSVGPCGQRARRHAPGAQGGNRDGAAAGVGGLLSGRKKQADG